MRKAGNKKGILRISGPEVWKLQLQNEVVENAADLISVWELRWTDTREQEKKSPPTMP